MEEETKDQTNNQQSEVKSSNFTCPSDPAEASQCDACQ